MGQAKRRGSFEKRKAEAFFRDKPALGRSLGDAIDTVDPDTFIHLFDVGTAAGVSASENAAVASSAIDEALTAASKELHTMAVEGKEAYLFRLLCIRHVYDSGRFGAYFTQTDDGHVHIAKDVLKRMATSPCFSHWNEQQQGVMGKFDLDALEAALRKPTAAT